MRNRKRGTFIRLFSSLAIVAIVVTGCVPDLVEVDKLNVVLGLGIDLNEDKTVTVSAQIVRSKAARGKEGQTSTQKPFYVREETAPTISEALRKFQFDLPRELFVAHNSVVVFGHSFAQSGISRAFDFFERDGRFRRTELFLTSSTDAKSVIQAPTMSESLSAMGIGSLVKQFSVVEPLYESKQLQVIKEYLSPSTAPILTRVALDESGSPVVNGVDILQHGQLRASLDCEESDHLAWLLGRAKNITVEIPCKKEEHAGPNKSLVRVLFSKSTIERVGTSKVPKFLVRIRATGEISRLCENESLDIDTIEKLEVSASRAVRRQMEDVVHKLQEKQVDGAELATQLFTERPAEWHRIANEWSKDYPKIQVQYDIQFHLIRGGLSAHDPDSAYSRVQLPPKQGREGNIP